jgi:hypothetical protein
LSSNLISTRGGDIIMLAVADFGCLPLLDLSAHSLQCRIGGALSVAIFNRSIPAIECISPPGVAGSLSLIDILLDGNPIAFSNRLFLTYSSDSSLLPSAFDANHTCSRCQPFLTSFCGLTPDCTFTWRGTAKKDGYVRFPLRLSFYLC